MTVLPYLQDKCSGFEEEKFANGYFAKDAKLDTVNGDFGMI